MTRKFHVRAKVDTFNVSQLFYNPCFSWLLAFNNLSQAASFMLYVCGFRSVNKKIETHAHDPDKEGSNFTAKYAQVPASLLQDCYLAVIKPISGCVRIACSNLMITSLLQVVSRLDESSFLRLLFTSSMQVVSTTSIKSEFHS